MPLEEPVAVARALASHGFNAEREAVTLLANAPDTEAALAHAVDAAPEGTTRLTVADVRPAIEATTGGSGGAGGAETAGGSGIDGRPADGTAVGADTDGVVENEDTGDTDGVVDPDDQPAGSTGSGDATPTEGSVASAGSESGGSATATLGSDTDSEPDATSKRDSSSVSDTPSPSDPSVSTGDGDTSGEEPRSGSGVESDVPPETKGSGGGRSPGTPPASGTDSGGPGDGARDPSLRSVEVSGDITGRSTGTGRYKDFVSVFRDRYERLARHLKGRVNHRSTDTLGNAGGGGDAGLVGMVAEINSTKSGHWMIDLEDTRGTFPCLVMKDKEIADHVNELLLDEVIAVEGSVSDDGSIMFVDDLHFPDIPRTYRPNTADRPVRAALISDVHVGSQEFLADAWSRFADWLHTDEAERVEYLCIAGDMVEGVGVYPDQDEELDIVDIYDQYEAFAERLKEVPGDMEIIMIPGNHDAVRLAEPQPGFDDELREIMDVHDPRIVGNPSTVTIEGVKILLYHGVSLDEVIAELPEEKASYDEPHKPMYQLLKKRHVAPQFGGHTRIAPEEKDYLVMDEVPDIFHTGHVHKFGYGKYRNVLAVNTGCWQAQTDFQESVNIDPDTAYAPVVDLHRLDEPDPMAIYDFN